MTEPLLPVGTRVAMARIVWGRHRGKTGTIVHRADRPVAPYRVHFDGETGPAAGYWTRASLVDLTEDLTEAPPWSSGNLDRQRIAQLEEDLAKATDLADQRREWLEQRTQRVVDLEKRIASTKYYLASAERDRNTARQERDQLRTEVQELQTELAELTGRLARSEEIEDGLRASIETLKSDRDDVVRERAVFAQVLTYALGRMDPEEQQRIHGYWDSLSEWDSLNESKESWQRDQAVRTRLEDLPPTSVVQIGHPSNHSYARKNWYGDWEVGIPPRRPIDLDPRDVTKVIYNPNDLSWSKR